MAKNMRLWLEKFLKEKELAWSPKTSHTVKHTLLPLLPYIDGNPKTLWDRLIETRKPYSRVTAWWAVSGFWDFITDRGENEKRPNPYQDFRRKNSRLFKNAYVKRTVSVSIEEATSLIKKNIEDPAIRKKALELLFSGMRFTESLTYKNGKVVGKGGKTRTIHFNEIDGPEYHGSYINFLRKLRTATGLYPHDLRKIFLSKIVENNANVFELQAVAGWSDIKTAQSYIHVNQNRIKALTLGIFKKAMGK